MQWGRGSAELFAESADQPQVSLLAAQARPAHYGQVKAKGLEVFTGFPMVTDESFPESLSSLARPLK